MATKKKKTAAKKPARAKKPAKRRAVAKLSADAMTVFLAQGREASADSITYMLRTCDSQMRAYGGFLWPQSGGVECPDWSPKAECGRGLHGLLMGDGDASLTSSEPTARWLVCAVWADDVVSIGSDKVKAPRAFVVFCGERQEAVAEITKLGATKPVYGSATAGYGGSATAGDGGSATAGDGGSATAGYGGSATAGEDGLISILRWNGSRRKYARGCIGENGLLPNIRYKLNEVGEFVRADPEKAAP